MIIFIYCALYRQIVKPLYLQHGYFFVGWIVFEKYILTISLLLSWYMQVLLTIIVANLSSLWSLWWDDISLYNWMSSVLYPLRCIADIAELYCLSEKAWLDRSKYVGYGLDKSDHKNLNLNLILHFLFVELLSRTPSNTN